MKLENDATPVTRAGLWFARKAIILVSLVMITITLAQVFFRYVLQLPIPWSEELARYCFIWIVFLGAGIGLQRRFHLGVDIFVNLARGSIRKHIEMFVYFAIALFSGVIIYASIPVLELNTFQTSPALQIPMSWVYLAIPVGMAILWLVSVERLIRSLVETYKKRVGNQ